MAFYSRHFRKQFPFWVDKFVSLAYAWIILLPKIKKNYAGSLTTEQQKLVKYCLRHGIQPLPFETSHMYSKMPIRVNIDSQSGLKYIDIDGKRPFFKKSMSKSLVRKYCISIMMEMDPKSPHRYVTSENKMIGADETDFIDKGHCVSNGDVVIDIGVAEGNFSVSIAEEACKLFLFEPDSEWADALLHTFKPNKNKVCICNKFVSDISVKDSISIDDFFDVNTLSPKLDKKTPVFIKIDVEGFEMKALNGMKGLLRYLDNIKLSVATYHKPEDMREISEFFKDVLGDKCSMEFTNGFALFPDAMPYFRKAVLRVQKNCSC